MLVTSLAFMADAKFLTVSKKRWAATISLPKALWLDWTLTTFYVVPFFLWKNTALSFHPSESLFGWLLVEFLFYVGLAELVVIYATHDWRCIYFGISHNGLSAGAGSSSCFFWLSRNSSCCQRTFAKRLLGFTCSFIHRNPFLREHQCPGAEFSLLADLRLQWGLFRQPSTTHFAFVNGLTWVELTCLWPWFCWLLWTTRTDFSRS